MSELSSHPEKWASQGTDEASSAVPGGKATAVLAPGAVRTQGIREESNLAFARRHRVCLCPASPERKATKAKRPEGEVECEEPKDGTY